jgi:acyl dehydratase
MMPAWAYAELEVGAVYRSRFGRTVLEADNVWFTLLTTNASRAVDRDARRARGRLGASALTMS